MKKTRTRIGSILLALALVLTLLPATALAAGVECSDGADCTHEAAIGSTHYETLQEALNAATNGDTVKLLKDIDNSVTNESYKTGISYSLKAGATLDGNDHKLSGHIGVYINAAGGTVKNVKFENIHNSTVVDKDTCDYYGWASKTGNQSAIYASSLTGTATITGCTFDNIDWDAIQITPTKTAGIVITDNVFQHTNTTDTQLRYIHIQYTAGSLGTAINELTITDNQFYTTKNPKDFFCSVGIWKVNKNTSKLQLSGNYVEDYTTTEVSVIGLEYLFPARSTPDAVTDDYQPVAYNGNEVYSTLQEAADKSDYYIKMMADAADQTATIPTGHKILFYSYGHEIGTLTNNGDLSVYGSDLAEGSKIINNASLSLKGNSATVYDIENNGTLEITSGATYDLSKITGSGTVSITGGTFATQPPAQWVKEWYIAEEQSNGTYKVSKMSASEAVAAGMVAASGVSGSSLNYYRSVTEGMNVTEKQNTVLHTDANERVAITTPMEKYSGIRVLNANGHAFTGSITIKDDCGSVRLHGKGNENEITLTDVRGELLYVGHNTTKADVTIKAAQLDTLDVVGYGDCTVEGGQYQNVVLDIYYKSGKPYGIPTLSITGGSFASDTVTVNHSNGTPSETAPLSDYVAERYMVVTGTGAYPYKVVEKSTYAAEVVPAAPSVTAPEGNQTAQNAADALKNAEDLVPSGSLSTAAGTAANNNTLTPDSTEVTAALEDAQVDSEGKDVTIVIQPYMDVKITDASDEGGTKSLTLEITPKYNVVATTADVTGSDEDKIVLEGDGVNAAIVKAAQPLTITQPVTVTIPLPENFLSAGSTYVKHLKNGRFVAYHAAEIANNVLTFVNDKGFSTFEITKDTRTATVKFGSDEQVYTPVNVGDALPTATAPSGQRFAGWTFPGIEGTYTTLTDDLLTQLAKQNNPITATASFVDAPSGGSGSSDAEGSIISVSSASHGTVRVNPGRAEKGDEVTVTAIPDDGYVLQSLTVTDKDGDTVRVSSEGRDKYTFTMPGSTVTVKAVFAPEGSTVVTPEISFTDVAESFWAYNEIQWAAENGYMTGTTATTFNPGGTVTRQQVWMILARMAGANPADMAAAKTWAVNNGISDGTNPGGSVTRQQLVALLYRFAGQNGYNVSAKADLSGYPDVASLASYATDAMAWSVANSIIGGTTAGTLNPAGTANRAQFAVILWRFYQTTAV